MQIIDEADLELLVKEIEGIVENTDMELWDIEVKNQNGSWVLRVFIDKSEGVSIDDCADISNQISIMLDIENIIPVRYVLEVSSPGLDRRLKSPDQFRRYIGKRVNIKLKPDLEGRKKYKGKIEEVGDEVVKLHDENEGQYFIVAINDISIARLEIEL